MPTDEFREPGPADMRRAMGRLCSGVAVVSTLDDDRKPCAMTISSLVSISLAPAIVMISLTHGARTTVALSTSGVFGVSVLGVRQEPLARRFATRGGDRFDDADFDVGHVGVPLIPGALAQLECRVDSRHDVSDHTVFFGAVASLRARDGEGLIFRAGRFGAFRDFGHDELPWMY